MNVNLALSLHMQPTTCKADGAEVQGPPLRHAAGSPRQAHRLTRLSEIDVDFEPAGNCKLHMSAFPAATGSVITQENPTSFKKSENHKSIHKLITQRPSRVFLKMKTGDQK